MSELVKAIAHLEDRDWQAAHVIVQADESAPASWAHGIVHLLEGDRANAAYWYRRAGRELPDAPDIDEEIAALKASLA